MKRSLGLGAARRLAVAATALTAIAGCGAAATDPTAAAAATSQFAATATAAPTLSATPASTLSAPPAPTPIPSAPAPAPVAAVHCADVSGVFVPHGTDGRGDCEPANRSAACHLAFDQQDSNYLATVVLDPPFANGVISQQYLFLIDSASNMDCWKKP